MTLLLSSWDDILQFILNIQTTGVSWGAVITAIILWGKIKRNKRFQDRDVRMEKKIDAIMQKVGVECASLTVTKYSTESFRMSSTSRSVGLLVVRIANLYTNYLIGRNQTMLTFLKSSISKKLLAFLVAAGVAALNTKLGLNLNAETVYAVIGLAITYIAGQSHVDGKKAISNAVNNAANAVIESAATTDGSAIKTITAPPMSFEDTMKMISDVHTDINRIFADAKNKDDAAAMQKAFNAYMTIHDYFAKNVVKP